MRYVNMDMDKMRIEPLLMHNNSMRTTVDMPETYKKSRKYRIKSLIKKICVTGLDNLP